MIYLIVRTLDKAIMGTEQVDPIEYIDADIFSIYLWDDAIPPIHDPEGDPPVESYFTENMALSSLGYTADRLLYLSDWATIPPGKGGPPANMVAQWNTYRRDVQNITDIWGPVWPTPPEGGRKPITI